MKGIIQDLCYFPSLYLILGISFVFNNISLKNGSILQRGIASIDKIIWKNLSCWICPESVEMLCYVQGWDIIFTEQVGILSEDIEQNTGQEIQT